jgi:transglutaminase-like putative cysteine protease
MPIRYDITHTTVYRYKTPVTFGLHRVMFRPRDSHDLRVLATDLVVSPEAYVRMIHDPHSNSVALVQPMGEARELRIVCSFTIEHVPTPPDELALDPAAELLPFAYSLEERLDLEHYLRPHHDDPDGTLIRWAHQFLHTDQPNNTRDVLTRMNAHIGQSLRYAALDTGEAEPGQAVSGAGSTHAWLHAYLPGAGWIAFDPTNNLMGGAQLIRVGVARDPALAAPISGSWYGDAQAYEGLEATVVVRRIAG